MKVSIGKNTLGGGKKMMTRLNNYNRSTHDNSFVMRTSMAPGVLVPTMTELLLPGDTYPIQTRCHTLTHPTIGPLFGSFKQQNDFFFCPIRLYNAMLHNNALNIGLDMKKVKFPYMRTGDPSREDESITLPGSGGTLLNQVHPSSLLGYLGWTALRKSINSGDPELEDWNFIKPIMYFDIFKNYYANKQEKKFFTIGGLGNLPYASNATAVPGSWNYIIASMESGQINGINTISDKNKNWAFTVSNSETTALALNINPPAGQTAYSMTLKIEARIDLAAGGGTGALVTRANLKFNSTIQELINQGWLKEYPYDGATNPIPNSSKCFVFTQTQGNWNSIGSPNPTTSPEIIKIGGVYNSYPLDDIDDMRENILAAGRSQYSVTEKFLTDIVKSIPSEYNSKKTRPACSLPMVGLALKTYQSDINTNWVNTEWIDGDTGINAITAIDTSSGSFTLDTLNLAKKVYTMLNRIAVSDGSYNAWIQTVYTSGGLNHIETPLYLGGSSLEIEFQEVVNNSGTEDQPLGTLAGRGIATNHKGGNIVFKADEPGYIFCITSITPRVDYFQGNEWDLYLNSLDDLHKPQLDGIGFQDRLYRHLNSSCNTNDLEKSIGKQPAWIQYMTNVNRTKGNFALIENEGWMCLNRIFGDIDTYTTYIQPHLYNNIFAETELTAQNFWVQIAFNYKPRRVMSAKVIPNI